MVIAYYIDDEKRKMEFGGRGSNPPKTHWAKTVKYVTSSGKAVERDVQVDRYGVPKNKLWGGLDKNGNPKASSLEEARRMQKNKPKDPQKQARMREIAARRKK